MKYFLGFLKKEFLHIFRDYRSMLILFGMPVAQVLLFGYIITNEIKDVKIAIYDKSNDEITNEMSQKILSSGFFHLDKRLTHSDQIKEIFKKGEVKEVIVFEDNFSENLEKDKSATIQLLADASDANTANLIVNYTQGIIRNYSNTLNSEMKMPLRIVPEVRMLYNESLKGVYMFVPGILAMILILISAMMTSITIAREKEMGTMEVILVSPLQPVQIVLGKVAPYFLLSFINATVLLALGYFVFNMPVNGSLTLLMAVTMLYILLSLSLGIFISTLAKTQQVAMFISMFALMLPTILLSGFIFPIENMPFILRMIAKLMPPKYFITIIKNIMIKGTGFLYIWEETLVLLAITSFFIVMSVRKFKIRLE
jgi:ABC-2 type transport system permease protein